MTSHLWALTRDVSELVTSGHCSGQCSDRDVIDIVIHSTVTRGYRIMKLAGAWLKGVDPCREVGGAFTEMPAR